MLSLISKKGPKGRGLLPQTDSGTPPLPGCTLCPAPKTKPLHRQAGFAVPGHEPIPAEALPRRHFSCCTPYSVPQVYLFSLDQIERVILDLSPSLLHRQCLPQSPSKAQVCSSAFPLHLLLFASPLLLCFSLLRFLNNLNTSVRLHSAFAFVRCSAETSKPIHPLQKACHERPPGSDSIATYFNRPPHLRSRPSTPRRPPPARSRCRISFCASCILDGFGAEGSRPDGLAALRTERQLNCPQLPTHVSLCRSLPKTPVGRTSSATHLWHANPLTTKKKNN